MAQEVLDAKPVLDAEFRRCEHVTGVVSCPGCGAQLTEANGDYYSGRLIGEMGCPIYLLSLRSVRRVRGSSREDGLAISASAGVSYRAVLRRDPCSYCGGPGGTVDHIDPVVGGGVREWDNLTGACEACNAAKGGLPLLRWLDVMARHYDVDARKWAA